MATCTVTSYQAQAAYNFPCADWYTWFCATDQRLGGSGSSAGVQTTAMVAYQIQMGAISTSQAQTIAADAALAIVSAATTSQAQTAIALANGSVVSTNVSNQGQTVNASLIASMDFSLDSYQAQTTASDVVLAIISDLSTAQTQSPLLIMSSVAGARSARMTFKATAGLQLHRGRLKWGVVA